MLERPAEAFRLGSGQVLALPFPLLMADLVLFWLAARSFIAAEITAFRWITF